jgi:hypothetical protein
VDDHFGIGYLPRLVYFEGTKNCIISQKYTSVLDGIPEMFNGAEVNEAEVLAWISKELATNEVKQKPATDTVISNVSTFRLKWSAELWRRC